MELCIVPYMGTQGIVPRCFSTTKMTKIAKNWAIADGATARKITKTLRATSYKAYTPSNLQYIERANILDYGRVPCCGSDIHCTSLLGWSLAHFQNCVKTEGLHVREPNGGAVCSGVNVALMAGFIVRLVTIQNLNLEAIWIARAFL